MMKKKLSSKGKTPITDSTVKESERGDEDNNTNTTASSKEGSGDIGPIPHEEILPEWMSWIDPNPNYPTKPSLIAKHCQLLTNFTEENLKDATQGMIYASLAITDDEADTLKKIGKLNPWQVQVMKMITGSNERAFAPLSEILKRDMKLSLDHIINCTKMTRGGHFIDTQGFIAHNDSTIVLSYRCTTSTFDWLTNINTTSSAWEIEEDHARGYSGLCSGFDGILCAGTEQQQRVHTGFYNNFLASLKDIKEHIEPLLAPDQPERKLFVTGHSLGAGIATLATCYFLLEHDWNTIPHKLVSVTAGSPRACCDSMAHVIETRMEELDMNKVSLIRLVKGSDVVTRLPPESIGFKHVGLKVKIEDDDRIVIKWKGLVRDISQIKVSSQSNGATSAGKHKSKQPSKALQHEDVVNVKSKEKKAYDELVQKIPLKFRDHMPDMYLGALFKHFSKEDESVLVDVIPGNNEGKKEKKSKSRRTWRLFGGLKSK